MEWSEQKDKNYHDLQWVKEKGLIDYVEESCGTGDSFIELGCGTGALLERISKNFKRCVGIDPSTSLLERAPKIENVEYQAKSLEEIEYSEEFDTVVLRNTLHHVADPEYAVRVAHRALRPGGRLVVCEGVPPSSRVQGFYENLFRFFDDRHILTEGDLIAMFRLARFEKVSLMPYFMENIDLVDWLNKVSSSEYIAQRALEMHRKGNEHFKNVYEVSDQNGNYTMTWRFVILTGVKAGA